MATYSLVMRFMNATSSETTNSSRRFWLVCFLCGLLGFQFFPNLKNLGCANELHVIEFQNTTHAYNIIQYHTILFPCRWPPKSSQGAFIYVTATFNYHQHLYKRRGGKTLIRATSLHLSICIAWSTRCPAILLRTGPSSRLPSWGPCAVPCTGWLERQSSPGYVTSAYINIACDWHQNPWKVTNGSCSQEDLLALSTHGPYLCLMHSEIWINSHNICMSLITLRCLERSQLNRRSSFSSFLSYYALTCGYIWYLHAFSSQILPCHTHRTQTRRKLLNWPLMTWMMSQSS